MSKANAAVVNYQTRPDNVAPKSIREISELFGVKYARLGLNVGSLPSFIPAKAVLPALP